MIAHVMIIQVKSRLKSVHQLEMAMLTDTSASTLVYRLQPEKGGVAIFKKKTAGQLLL